MDLRLGIDTGGTFTDAVLVDADRRIVQAEKSLTTRFDLSQGIGDVIGRFDAGDLQRVGMVSLSTTLTTNSVVEQLGAPVAVLLPGYDAQQIGQSGLLDILPQQAVVILRGGFDAGGAEQAELDEASARDAIQRLADEVQAFAISSMFGVRNNAHEARLKSIVMEMTGLPVICGHELASSLGAPRRALTAALNARMVAPIRSLMEAVKQIMQRHRIDAPLMIVKGDGSLASESHAIERPIGTVLSGPAASVIGACALSGRQNAIVADMGGTTTDVAVVRNGQPRLAREGALIGDWQPMVEAVEVTTLGLGGDSELRFSGHSGLCIGPRRVVPTSLLAAQYPQILPQLEAQLNDMVNARSNRFITRLENNPARLARLDADEREAWDLLGEGPLELDAVVRDYRNLGRALARLKRLGLAIYSGFTPTDAAHVLGLNDHWNRAAAELSARLWMRQMKYLQGFGNWVDDDTVAACTRVYDSMQAQIRRTLVGVGLDVEGHNTRAAVREQVIDSVTRMVTGWHQESGEEPLFKVSFAADFPVVGVGAPASTWYPEAVRSMGLELVVPEHAEVANAYGAVMGSIIQRAQVTLSQPNRGEFKLFHAGEPLHFDSLEEARACAENMVTAQAAERACSAGAVNHEITVDTREVRVDDGGGGVYFLEATVVATAVGPACLWRAEWTE